MALSEPIRDVEELRMLAGYWLERGNVRNYVLIVLGVCTALRVGDLLRLTWDDVYDARRGGFRSHLVVVEMKTGKPRVGVVLRGGVRDLTGARGFSQYQFGGFR